MNKGPRQSPSIRFWNRIKPNGECWEFSSINHWGYGQFYLKGKMLRAHRLRWIWANGEIPKGLNVLHSCDNRRCVRLEHLRLGTQKENIIEAWEKKRMPMNLKPRHGDLHHFTKIPDKEARKIHAIGLTKKFKQVPSLAEKYGVSVSRIYQILRGERWNLC